MHKTIRDALEYTTKRSLPQAAGVPKGIPFGHNPRPTIKDIVCAYKSLTTKQCKSVHPIDKLFQTSFYEHVIRGQEDYEEIAEYIMNNPKQWELDTLYSKE